MPSYSGLPAPFRTIIMILGCRAGLPGMACGAGIVPRLLFQLPSRHTLTDFTYRVTLHPCVIAALFSRPCGTYTERHAFYLISPDFWTAGVSWSTTLSSFLDSVDLSYNRQFLRHHFALLELIGASGPGTTTATPSVRRKKV